MSKNKSGKENIFQSRIRKPKNTFSKDKKKDNIGADLGLEEITNGSMLKDIHIGRSMELIKTQHSELQGLQDPILGSKLQFNVCKQNFIQVLHDGSLHWLVVSNVHCDNGYIDMYDSLYSRVNMNVKMQMASIMMLDKPEMIIRNKRFQRQKGGVDCGPFAVAAAVTLANGGEPAHLQYDQGIMRNHLHQCLQVGKISEFPSHKIPQKKSIILSQIHVPLYCICRLPDNKEERMISCKICKQWFHQTCLSVTAQVFQDSTLSSEWACNKCKGKR